MTSLPHASVHVCILRIRTVSYIHGFSYTNWHQFESPLKLRWHTHILLNSKNCTYKANIEQINTSYAHIISFLSFHELAFKQSRQTPEKHPFKLPRSSSAEAEETAAIISTRTNSKFRRGLVRATSAHTGLQVCTCASCLGKKKILFFPFLLHLHKGQSWKPERGNKVCSHL